MYLTPAQFRAKDYGAKLDDFTDAQLAGLLSRAASDLHTYTCVPTLPVPHDFRGGTITGESHTWHVDQYDRYPQRRIFPYHRPVRSVTQMRLYVTKGQYVDLGSSEAYYELGEGWIEPSMSGLTSYGLLGGAILPWTALEHPHVILNYTYGRQVPTTERLYYTDDVTATWRATIGFWDSTVAPVVKVNGAVRASGYTVDYIEGTIKFTTSIPVDGDTVDATFTGTLHPSIPEAQGLIAVARVSDRSLLTTSMGGLRRLSVAEITIERDGSRQSGQASKDFTIPDEAANLLDPFVFRALAFA